MSMKLSKILRKTECESKLFFDTEIENITSKLDSIKDKTLFFLFRAVNFDTRKIIDKVFEKNPALIITDTDIEENGTVPIIKIQNARSTYAYAMWNFCEIDTEHLKFYGVTGTNGKTTTATMLFNIFRTAKIKCGFIGTGKIIIDERQVSDMYYSMTTPDPDLLYPTIKRMQEQGCKVIVMEVSSHALFLQKVAPIRFECSIFTNLSEEHMDFHKSIKEYYATKLSLFFQSKKAILNLDDPYGRLAFSELSPLLETYGVSIRECADATAKDIQYQGFQNCCYIYREANRIFKIIINCVGEYNISNSLLAIKCAINSGIDEKTIKESLYKQSKIDGRFETVSTTPTVIIDYAHTYKALKSILEFIISYKREDQKIITLFGCGGERDRTKRPKMAQISEAFSDFTIVTADNSRNEKLSDIISEIESGFTKKDCYKVIENRKKAIIYSIELANDDDVVLLIGKGHERYNIDAEGYHTFDERSIITKAIEEKQRRKNENKNFS